MVQCECPQVITVSFQIQLLCVHRLNEQLSQHTSQPAKASRPICDDCLDWIRAQGEGWVSAEAPPCHYCHAR